MEKKKRQHKTRERDKANSISGVFFLKRSLLKGFHHVFFSCQTPCEGSCIIKGFPLQFHSSLMVIQGGVVAGVVLYIILDSASRRLSFLIQTAKQRQACSGLHQGASLHRVAVCFCICEQQTKVRPESRRLTSSVWSYNDDDDDVTSHFVNHQH